MTIVLFENTVSNFIGINTMTKYNLSGIANGTGMIVQNHQIVKNVISNDKSTNVKPKLATINVKTIHDGLGSLVPLEVNLYLAQENGTFYIHARVTDKKSELYGEGKTYADTEKGILVTFPFSLTVFNEDLDRIIPLGNVDTVISIDKVQNKTSWKEVVVNQRALEITISASINYILYNDQTYEINYFDSIAETEASLPSEGFQDYTISVLSNQGNGIIFYRCPFIKNTEKIMNW